MMVNQQLLRAARHRRSAVLLALVSAFLLSACGGSLLGRISIPQERSSRSGNQPDGGRQPTQTATFYILALSRVTPSLTPKPTRSATPRPTATPTTPPPTATPTPTHKPTITPTSTEVFQICSPLVANTIDELPKIVSDAYDPPKSWGSDERHHGVDLSYHRWKDSDRSILGIGVQSVMKGQVSAALADTYPLGNLVIIETLRDTLPQVLVEALNIPEDRSIYLLYAHLDEPPLIGLGDQVAACQLIGAVGRSGNTEVPHLHLETRLGPPGATFTGLSRFIESATEEEKANYNLWRISGTFRHFDPMSLLLFDLGSIK